MDKKEVDSKIVKKKLEAFKNIVKNCTKQIKAGFPWFKLDITTTVSYEGGAQKVNFRKDGEPVCAIDFPARDVLTKNAAQLTNEVYSRLYGAATHWKNTQENAKAEKNNEKSQIKCKESMNSQA